MKLKKLISSDSIPNKLYTASVSGIVSISKTNNLSNIKNK